MSSYITDKTRGSYDMESSLFFLCCQTFHFLSSKLLTSFIDIVFFQTFRVGVQPHWLKEIYWSDVIFLVDDEQSHGVVNCTSLQLYGQIRCNIIVPSPRGNKLCSLMIKSSIAMEMRILSIQEITRIVWKALPRSLILRPVLVNDVTTKVR